MTHRCQKSSVQYFSKHICHLSIVKYCYTFYILFKKIFFCEAIYSCLLLLKGQCPENFFFCLIHYCWAPYEQAIYCTVQLNSFANVSGPKKRHCHFNEVSQHFQLNFCYHLTTSGLLINKKRSIVNFCEFLKIIAIYCELL